MCGCGLCPKCKGGKVFVAGLLILLNAWKMFASWPMFIGGLVALWGLASMVKPMCPCNEKMMKKK